MSLEQEIRQAIETCGGTVELEAEGQVYRFAACIQPQGEIQGKEPSPFGDWTAQRYAYYGPLEGGGTLVKPGATLKMGQETFLVMAAEDYWYGGSPVYRKAVLGRCLREEQDGMDFQYEEGAG